MTGGGGRFGWRLAHLPVLVTVSAVLLAGAAAVGGVARGGAGAAGAAAGVGIVVASFLVSTLLMAWADSVDPRLVLPVGLTAYAVKFTLIGVVMAGLVASGWDGLGPLGVGVIAGVLVWVATHIWWVLRRPPRLEYTPPRASDPDGHPSSPG